MLILAEVISTVLTEAIVAGGRRAAIAAGRATRSKRSGRFPIEEFFDAYAAGGAPPLDEGLLRQAPPGLAEALADPRVRGAVHELFAVRMSGAPAEELDQARTSFRLALGSCLPWAPPGELSAASDALFGYFDARISAAVEEFRKAHATEFWAIRNDSRLSAIKATVAAISRHTAALAGTADPAAERRFLDAYRRQVLDFHGRLEPPDFERRRRVPIDEIFVSPVITPVLPDGGRSASFEEDPQRLSVLEFAEVVDRSVLLGDPGGGKTTTSHALMHLYAAQPRDRVPFLVTLREFAVQDRPAWSVAEYLDHTLRTFYQCPAPAGLVERLLLSGMAMVIFDGLDELLDSGHRAGVASIVERFAAEYPLTSILVTSRVVGYEQAGLDRRQFSCHRIRGFDQPQVAEYVAKWFAQEETLTPDERDRGAADFIAGSAAMADLRANPLMLSLMCILYRGEGSLPRSRPEIYEQCATLMFRRWDARRRIHSDVRARDLVEPLLRHLAYWLFTGGRPAHPMTERALVAEATEFLLGRGFGHRDEAAAAAAELIAFTRGRAWVFSDVGLTSDGQELYAFTHRTFLEYFTAARISARHDSPAELAHAVAPHLAEPDWDVVAQLALQLKDRHSDRGAERFYHALLADQGQDEERRETTLAFLGRCLAFSTVPAETVRRLVRAAADLAFRDNGHGSSRLTALGWVMYGGVDHREIVRSEIISALESRIDRSNEDERIRALKLALSLADLPMIVSDVDVSRSNSALWRPWQDVSEEFSRRYGDEIAELARRDLSLAANAFLERRIGVTCFVECHGPALTGLLRSIPHLVHIASDRYYGYYRYRPLVSELLGGPLGYSYHRPDEETWWPWIEEQLRRLGDLLNGYPDPPWANSGESDMDMSCRRFFPRLPQSGLTTPHGNTAVAMGVLLFATAEVEVDADALSELAAATPHLGAFVPYLRRRRGQDVRLPDLPVNDRFRALFRGWAAGTVAFTHDEGRSLPT
ncbi:NACHT domain-containing protein [Actinoallomurus sp. CA-142502]|uniref:NACHT domain-containing protein n=1 Tax=Actinoallomurus sp. CA-142502 TaxID=3239885 RepID=UPI003D94ED7C